MRPGNLAGTSHNPLDYIGRAHKARNPAAIRKLLSFAKRQHVQACMVGWPALEQSFAQDIEVLEAILTRTQQETA
jgi:hypothetical protein